jgi:ABC-type lipoprotein export system ATPase subunit
MLNHPKLILADEPTGNLDTGMGKEVMNSLKKLKEEQGTTILLVTHDVHIASYAGEILNIQDGVLAS